MTDEEWQQLTGTENAPTQPAWATAIHGSRVTRPEPDTVTVSVRGGSMAIDVKDANGGGSGTQLLLHDASLQILAASYPNVHGLDLSDSPITDEGLGHLRSLPDLRSLDMSRTPISDAGLVHLSGHRYLQSLSLAEADVSDTGLKHLTSLQNLHFLDLRGTRVTAAGVSRLQRALANTEIVR